MSFRWRWFLTKVRWIIVGVRRVLSLLCSAWETSGPPALWTCWLAPGASLSSWDTRPLSPASPSRPDASLLRPLAEPGWLFCSPPPMPSLCASNSPHCRHKAEIMHPKISYFYIQTVEKLFWFHFSLLFFFWLLHFCYTWLITLPFLFSFLDFVTAAMRKTSCVSPATCKSLP